MYNTICRLFSVTLFFAVAALSAQAEDSKQPLQVKEVWATPTFPMAMMGAAYITLQNGAQNTVKISGLSLDPKIASSVELHESYLDGEMAKMRELSMPYAVLPGETVTFQPGGKHIMIMGLKGPLAAGNVFSLTLHFEDGGSQTIEVPIKESGEADSTVHHHHH